MGAYTCEYGVIHKMCRCRTAHTIRCDRPEEHGYKPKHRAEPVVKHRVTIVESERGRQQDFWTEDFDTPQDALNRIDEINSQNTSLNAPDYYIKAMATVERVEL